MLSLCEAHADFNFSNFQGLGLLSSPFPLLGSFDLDNLNQHNFPIEHDASRKYCHQNLHRSLLIKSPHPVSRQDAYFGDDHTFYDPIWQDVLSFYGDSDMTALLPASKSIANRTADSQAINPTFTYGFREFIQRYGEDSIYLQAMGSDDISGVTRIDWVKALFEEERLPYDLGWRPRKEPITVASLGLMVFNLFNASPQKVPEGKKVLL